MSADESRKIIGGFRVLKDLKAGAGSQGTVYQAVCEVSRFPSVAVGDVVALKVMAVQDDDGEVYARLERRTAELVALEHPNVVKYHGCFCEKGPFNDVHVIVLEFVEGRSLKELLSESPCGLGTDDAMRIAFGMVDGLAYTSGRGIVHRDVKPANVIVSPDGTPKLIDFEVAHRVEGTATVGGSNMIGTFDYMAPDFTDAAFRGDVRSDVFSMGVCLHEMLTGRTPYRRQSDTSSQANVAFLQRWLKVGTSANPLTVSSRVEKLLPGARNLLERALSPDRAHRIADFPSFREALGRVRYRELAHAGHTWRLLSYIGHGGFGEVFGAVDCASGGRVAVKHLLNELSETGVDRFRREAETLRRVSGAGFPRFIDYFKSEDGGSFLVMDYLEGMPGQSLKDVLNANRGRKLDPKTVMTAFARYASALAGLHAIGVVHRDVKPANLYFPVARPEHAVVMDLGIVRDLSGTATVGHVPGTIDYMPPECVTGQARGGPEADIWALGLCLYEALASKPAYPRLPDGTAALQAYFERVKNGVRPDFSGVDDKPEVRELLGQMCKLDPKERLRDVRLVERWLRILNGEDPADLPVPKTDFVWKEGKEDDDYSEGSETDFGKTRETVWFDLADPLAVVPSSPPAKKKSKGSFVFLLFVVLLLAAGGFGAWKYAEYRKAADMAKAAERARLAAEEAKRKAEADAEAKRKADAEAEVQRKAAAEAEAKRKAEMEAKRLEAEKAEAERKSREEAAAKAKAAADKAEAERKSREEAAAKAKAAAAKAEAERKAHEEAAAKAKAAAEKAEAERKAREEAAAKAKATADKAEAERKAREEAAAKAKAAAEKAEAERKSREEAAAKAKAAAAKAEAERKAREEAAAKAKIAAEKAAAEKAAAEKAEAERERKEKEALAREIDAEAEVERRKKLKQLDDDFAAYTLDYHKQLEEALKPGSRADPVSLQQEYLLKKRAYKEARKKLENGK